jgi:hypothetical protein
MFRHCNIHKYTWTSPEGKTHNQIDHVLIDRWYSSILHDCSFRGVDCDTDRCLVVAEVREGLAVSKQAAQKMGMERFSMKKLNKGEIKEQYQVTVTNKFAVPENLDDNGDIGREWDTVRGNIKISAKESLGYCEMKHHRTWFDEECSKFVHLRKQAKLQWLQDPSEVN